MAPNHGIREAGGESPAVKARPWLLLAAGVAAFDQGTKAAMMQLVPVPGSALPVAGFLNLVHVRNPGVSFGLAPGLGPWVLGGVALAIVAVLLVWLARARDRATAAALALTIGGAFGNVIDRARFGAVFDFLDFHAFGYHWPAFNAADSAIVVGVAGLLFGPLFQARRAAANEDARR